MENILEYKGYYTKIAYDSEEKILHGKVEDIDDFVNFESDDARQIVEEFHRAVDDYLDFCEKVGKNPEKAYRGSFNVRIGSELHRKLAAFSDMAGESLNQTVQKAIASYITSVPLS